MKHPNNLFAHALSAGQPQIGLWLSLCSDIGAEVVADSGFDWALIDMEHAPNDLISVLSQLQVFASRRTTALVRPEWNDPVLVKRLLDLGVPGLIFPMIQSVQEAEQAVAATRYPPLGIRGVTGISRATAFGRKTDYFARAEDETTVIVQLETRQAVERACDIAAVQGVDGVFFGPSDIAADIGQLGKPTCDEVWDLILPTAKALAGQGVAVGTLALDADFAAKLLNTGFRFVACGMDTALLARASDELLGSVKGQLKNK